MADAGLFLGWGLPVQQHSGRVLSRYGEAA